MEQISPTKSLSVVVPAYNEDKIIEQFIIDIINFLNKRKIDYELIIVENGSNDSTWEIICQFAKKHKQIKAVKIKHPSYGLALRTGILKAVKNYLYLINIDFWDRKMINDFLKYQIEADIIVGSKLINNRSDQRTLARKSISLFFNRFLQIIYCYQGTDTHGLKLINREKIMPIIKVCQLHHGLFDTEMMIRAQRHNLIIKEVPVSVKEIRPNRFGWKRILKTPLDIFFLIRALK